MSSSTEGIFGSRWTSAWTRLYTRGLDPGVAADRMDELAADLHDHLSDALDSGCSTAAASRAVVTRMLLGVPADLSWRSEQARAHRPARQKEIAMNYSTQLRNGTVVLGSLVAAFGVTMSVGAAIAEGIDVLWFSFVAVTVLSLIGLTLVIRRQPVGAGLLAVATFGMCVAFYWFAALWVLGGILITFFIIAMTRERASTSASATAATSPR